MESISKIFFLIYAIMMAAYFVLANPVELTGELNEDHDSGPDGGLYGASIGDLWGTGDVLDDGLSNLVEPRSATCTKVKNEAACKTCCEQTNRAHKYTIHPSLKKNWGVCTCYVRVTPKI